MTRNLASEISDAVGFWRRRTPPGRCRRQGAQCNHWAGTCIEQNNGGLACTLPGPAISTCATHSTLDVGTGHREGVAPRRTCTSTTAPMQT